MPHAHVTAARAARGRLLAVLVLSLVALAIEVIGAVVANSLSLLADAGHLLTDVVGIGLALLATWFAGRPPTLGRTFGYLPSRSSPRWPTPSCCSAWRATSCSRPYGASTIRRRSPRASCSPSRSSALPRMACRCSCCVTRRLQPQRAGAYLEVLGDLGGSAAVIVAAIVIALTGWDAADTIASLLIAALILPRTLRLLREATDVLLEATPRDVDLDHVRRHILDAPGVIDCHDSTPGPSRPA